MQLIQATLLERAGEHDGFLPIQAVVLAVYFSIHPLS